MEIHAPSGITATPAVIEGELDGAARGSYPVQIAVASGAEPGTRIVALDATLDRRRYGEWFDFIIQVQPWKA